MKASITTRILISLSKLVHFIHCLKILAFFLLSQNYKKNVAVLSSIADVWMVYDFLNQSQMKKRVLLTNKSIFLSGAFKLAVLHVKTSQIFVCSAQTSGNLERIVGTLFQTILKLKESAVMRANQCKKGSAILPELFSTDVHIQNSHIFIMSSSVTKLVFC